MRIVIHQPYFLPWLGFFSKLLYCDAIIILDNVNFRKRHYHDRTRIINMHGDDAWLRLQIAENFKTPINEVYIEKANTLERIAATLCHSYAKAHCFDVHRDGILNILRETIIVGNDLASVNTAIIKSLCDLIGICECKFLLASQFDSVAEPTERLIRLCQQTKAEELLIGSGSSTEVHDWSRLQKLGITICYQDFLAHHPTYSQSRKRARPFISGLSIVDAIFNEGMANITALLCAPELEPIVLKKNKMNEYEN